jgi:hypothetical protein
MVKRAGMGFVPRHSVNSKGERGRPLRPLYSGLFFERRNFAVTRPKLDVVPVNELLGAFLGGVIVGTD